MMKKYLALAAASLIGLAGVATAAENVANTNAQAGKRGYSMKANGELPRDLQALNLSNKQKADIQKIMEANRPQRAESILEGQSAGTSTDQAARAARRAEMQQKMTAHRTAEHNLISAKRFDEAAARNMIAERQAAHEQHAAERRQHHAERELSRLKERHAIFQVLTTKQQQQWLENQNKRMEKRAHFGGKRGEARTQAPAQP